MRQIILSLCCLTVITSVAATLLSAQESSLSLSFMTKSFDCTKEELRTYFPKPIVQQILTEEKFTSEQTEKISQELSKKDKELEKIVEEKASKLNPNPFKDLNQRDLANKIYRETLFEVFEKVLKENGLKDEKRIQQLLDTIQQTKSKLFIECIRKQQMTVPVS